MKAPLPIPSKTTARGKTQHKEATNAEAKPTILDFTPYTFILKPQITFFEY
jgi:hypothetical protein